MTSRRTFWTILALAGLCAQGSAAWAQIGGGSNGPITGIPSGLGANGSMTFTPGPADQPALGTPGNMPTVGVPGRTVRTVPRSRANHGRRPRP